MSLRQSKRQPKYTVIISKMVKRKGSKIMYLGRVYQLKKNFYSKKLKRRFSVFYCISGCKSSIRELLDVDEPVYYISDRVHNLNCSTMTVFRSRTSNNRKPTASSQPRRQVEFVNLPPPYVVNENRCSMKKKRKLLEIGRTESLIVGIYVPECFSGIYADLFVNLIPKDAYDLLQNTEKCIVMFGSVKVIIYCVRNTLECPVILCSNRVSEDIVCSDFSIHVYIPENADPRSDVKLIIVDGNSGSKTIFWRREEESNILEKIDLFPFDETV